MVPEWNITNSYKNTILFRYYTISPYKDKKKENMTGRVQYRFPIDHFRVAVYLIMKARLSAKLFILWKLVLSAYEWKLIFILKTWHIAFMMRFKATRKWPIWARSLELKSQVKSSGKIKFLCYYFKDNTSTYFTYWLHGVSEKYQPSRKIRMRIICKTIKYLQCICISLTN